MQEELLAKFKEEHGELPIWNTKKKVNVKAEKTPGVQKQSTSREAQNGCSGKCGCIKTTLNTKNCLQRRNMRQKLKPWQKRK